MKVSSGSLPKEAGLLLVVESSEFGCGIVRFWLWNRGSLVVELWEFGCGIVGVWLWNRGTLVVESWDFGC